MVSFSRANRGERSGARKREEEEEEEEEEEGEGGQGQNQVWNSLCLNFDMNPKVLDEDLFLL